MNKKCIILGGGTFNPVSCHLSLAAPAFGETARKLYSYCLSKFHLMDVELVLTKMADSNSKLITTEDLEVYVDELINNNTTKVVFFNVAVCDFAMESPSDEKRLSSKKNYPTTLLGIQDKLLGKIRKHRKDIFVVGFKTTKGATPEEQFAKGLDCLKKNSANLILCNDVGTRHNFIVTPEEGVYNGSREELLCFLVDMAYNRSYLSFTRSTVVEGNPVAWEDNRVPSNLRFVIDYLVTQGAYKVFNGATTGHFATKLGEGHFLTSIRKTNFNDISKNGMVEVKTDGDDCVISLGAKPSVGGQSQRIIFDRYKDLDCIVHFHCPLKEHPRNNITVQSQWQYECGSHECGENTANGLRKFGNLYAVMLDKHGPNIVFSKHTNRQEIIDFIEANFDLDKPTNGFEQVYFK